MLRLFAAAALAGALSGCVAAGVSQQDSETTYMLTTIAGDAYLKSAHTSAEQWGQACIADNAFYATVTATRNVADNVNYAPSDSAHAALQHDGAKFNPEKCAI